MHMAESSSSYQNSLNDVGSEASHCLFFFETQQHVENSLAYHMWYFARFGAICAI